MTAAPAIERTERTPRELIRATRAFAQERRARSWQLLAVTVALLAGAVALAAAAPWWPVRLAAAVVSGLLVVRTFIFFHDYQHGAILRGSPAAKLVFTVFGILTLTPPRVWKQTHNHHHAHTAKLRGSHIGSFWMMSCDAWQRSTPRQRLAYRLTRHPLTILLGYFTVFLGGMCLSSFLRDPRRCWDSGLALAVHVALAAALWLAFGFATVFFALLLPLMIASALGSYLFYAQHNFPTALVHAGDSWSYGDAALDSSSYMRLGPFLRWITGNIGYHHVHHLNAKIPFYRLPETMAAIPELQHPRGVTSLHPRDVLACLRLKLWDAAAGRLVRYPTRA